MAGDLPERLVSYREAQERLQSYVKYVNQAWMYWFWFGCVPWPRRGAPGRDHATYLCWFCQSNSKCAKRSRFKKTTISFVISWLLPFLPFIYNNWNWFWLLPFLPFLYIIIALIQCLGSYFKACSTDVGDTFHLRSPFHRFILEPGPQPVIDAFLFQYLLLPILFFLSLLPTLFFHSLSFLSFKISALLCPMCFAFCLFSHIYLYSSE